MEYLPLFLCGLARGLTSYEIVLAREIYALF